MKFLVVQALWVQSAVTDMADTLRKLGHEAEEYPVKLEMASYLSDDEVDGLVSYISEHRIDVVMSIYFAMNAAMAAYKMGIKYVSILWDAPYLEHYNPLGKIDNVWISTFDKLEQKRFREYGMKHVLYQPLSVNKRDVIAWNRDIRKTLQGQYIHDISFIGNLYSSNLYKQNLPYIPVELQYYFNSIFEEAAFRWDGVNRVYGKTGAEVIEYIKKISPDFSVPNRQDIEDVRYFEGMGLVREIAHIERIAVLNLLAEEHSVTLYTSDTHTEMPLVFRYSKINLNITLKGIEGGTPQRVIDVMGAGGFVLTSFCEETAELFEEDEEIVMFRTPEELVEKAAYYLAHDKERRQIAINGSEKVIRCYTYEKKLQDMVEWLAET